MSACSISICLSKSYLFSEIQLKCYLFQELDLIVSLSQHILFFISCVKLSCSPVVNSGPYFTYFNTHLRLTWGLPQWLSGEESACQWRIKSRSGFDPWVGKIPLVGSGNPLQSSCLEDPMDRGAWRATVHRVAKSWTWWAAQHAHMHAYTQT